MNTTTPPAPRYFRLLEKGETIEKGDKFLSPSDGKLGSNVSIGANVGSFGREYDYFRPVTVDPWISYAEQKPTKEDFEPTGALIVLREDAKTPFIYYPNDLDSTYLWNATNAKALYWHRVTPPTPASATVILEDKKTGGRREVTFHADGRATLGCGDVYSSESIDEAFKAREGVMKK